MHYNDLLRDYYQSLHGEGNEAADSRFSPLCSINHSDETELLKWLIETNEALQRENQFRAENQLRNVQFYHGVHTLQNNQSVRAVDYDKQPISMENRFVMNHILEFTLHKQSRLMRFSPTINVFPWNNEYRDRLGARLGKKIIDSAFYSHDYDSHLGNITLEAGICGESFLLTLWDKYAGEEDKDVAKAKLQATTDGVFKTADGKDIKLDTIPRAGDHKLVHPLPWMVLHEPRVRWTDVEYGFVAEFKHIDIVKAEHAGLSDKDIKKIQDGAANTRLPGKEFVDFGNFVLEWTFYHKRTRFVPNGKYAKYYNGCLLEMGDLPYKEFPIVRFTDYDDPINAHGKSFYESLKLPSVMINNMMKVAYRSFIISAYPKIIMQEGACNMYSMANGPFVIEHQPGATVPQIVSFNAVNSDFFPLTQHVEGFMEKNSGTFGISRGQAMPNARAASILNFYEEQEQERESSQIRKLNAFIEKTARNMHSNFVEKVNPEDARTIRIIGKSNQYKVQKLGREDFKLLGSDKVIKVQRTTALSESKQGRIDQITALSNVPVAGQEGVGLFTREQILQMIEVADIPTFFEMATAAAERAMSEAEDLFDGRDVPPAKEHQALLVYWNVYFQFMQSSEFNDTKGVPEEVQKNFLKHVRTIEMFLYNKAKFNLALATMLAKNPYFPSVYKTDPASDLPLSQIVLALSNPPPPPVMPPPMPGDGGIPENTGPSESVQEDPLTQPDLAVDEPQPENMIPENIGATQ